MSEINEEEVLFDLSEKFSASCIFYPSSLGTEFLKKPLTEYANTEVPCKSTQQNDSDKWQRPHSPPSISH